MNSNSTAIVRTQVAQVVRQIAAAYAKDAIEGVMAIAEDADNEPADRLKAYGMILDRAAGKPTQEVAEEGVGLEAIVDRLREARTKAQSVMDALPKPSERPMTTDNVVELRPDKSGVFVPRGKIQRRRLKED